MRNTLVELRELLSGEKDVYQSGTVIGIGVGKATVRLESGMLRDVYGSAVIGDYLLVNGNQIVAKLEKEATGTAFVE